MLILLQFACTSTVPASITKRAYAAIDPDAAIFVIASQQREAIVASLEKAGARLSPDPEGMDYALDVQLGQNRAIKNCGSVHNVSYSLTRAGRRLMVIKGRGATGTCDPNIFDDMSRELVANMH